MEIVDAKSLRGMVKIAGTVVSLAGVTTMTLYKGEAITGHWKPPIHMPGSSVVRHSWWRGPILALASCLCWSIWFILQIIGGAVVILGLYMLLWGKGKDQIDNKSSTEQEPERDGDQSEASYAVP
uniref:WAT1-related protein n=1 Tax=Saccharum officinarum TaxID=4547 RepID=A0A678TPX0_SACOF|nr:WAT1-related protein [Saccharum officinarum]